MKRLFTPVVCAALALTLAAGCGQTTAPSSAEEPQAHPLHLETLAVELPRDYAPDDETLLQAIANAPELLKAALAKQQVEVDAVTVTVGASAGATCQALTGGTVDLAFLSAESYLEAGGGGTVILADAGEGDRLGPLECPLGLRPGPGPTAGRWQGLVLDRAGSRSLGRAGPGFRPGLAQSQSMAFRPI